MIGMLQIITYMMAFYLVLKGVEILQIGLASSRANRKTMLTIGGLCVAACVVAAFGFVTMQDNQAKSSSSASSSFPY